MYVKKRGASGGRRPSRYNSAIAGSMTIAYWLGAGFLTYMNIYRDSHHSGCQHRQSQELTQHAVVLPRGHSSQVAMTTMVYTVGTFRLYGLASFMDMNRR